jgi:hypothetical protein
LSCKYWNKLNIFQNVRIKSRCNRNRRRLGLAAYYELWKKGVNTLVIEYWVMLNKLAKFSANNCK